MKADQAHVVTDTEKAALIRAIARQLIAGSITPDMRQDLTTLLPLAIDSLEIIIVPRPEAQQVPETAPPAIAAEKPAAAG